MYYIVDWYDDSDSGILFRFNSKEERQKFIDAECHRKEFIEEGYGIVNALFYGNTRVGLFEMNWRGK